MSAGARQAGLGWRCLALMGLAVLIVGCQLAEQPTPRLTLPGALTEMRVVNAQEIARTEHEDQTMVLFYGQQGVQNIVAHVVLDRASQSVREYGTDAVEAPAPGTASFSGYDTRLLIFGRVIDPAITSLEIDFGPESRLFPVAVPGYVLVIDDPPGEVPQCWRFLDAQGEPVYVPAGPC